MCLSPLPGWAQLGNEALEGGEAIRPPLNVLGGHLTPVKSIIKMQLHTHGVASLQTFAKNGLNGFPSPRWRHYLFLLDKFMHHIFTYNLTPCSFTRPTVDSMVVMRRCANGIGLAVDLCQCKTSTSERRGSGGWVGESGGRRGGRRAFRLTRARRQE